MRAYSNTTLGREMKITRHSPLTGTPDSDPDSDDDACARRHTCAYGHAHSYGGGSYTRACGHSSANIYA